MRRLMRWWRPTEARRPEAGQRGFTLLELLIGGSIAVIGLYATMAMAMAALRGNTERRESLLAEQLAQHILATIQAESSMWTEDDPGATTPRYLNKLPLPAATGGTSGWLGVPSNPFSVDKRVGALGADTAFYDPGILLEIPMERGTRYCGHYRLTWVSSDLARAEVRITWPRPQVDADKYIACPVTMVDDIGNVGSVTLPAMVMRNVYVQ